MKKVKLLVALGVCGLVLGACSSEEAATPEKESTSQVAVSTEESSVVESEVSNTASAFKDNELVTQDMKIKITETRIIPVGEIGNEYGEKPVIAFWYETTNLSDEELDPSSAWIFAFRAFQDNSADSMNELNVASLPDEAFLDSQSEMIKKDGTVTNAMAYELDDDVTPVTLTAEDMITGEEMGTVNYEVK